MAQKLQAVRAEIRQVHWPSRKTLTKNTASVLIWSASLAAIIFLSDSVLSAGLQMLLRLFPNS